MLNVVSKELRLVTERMSPSPSTNFTSSAVCTIFDVVWEFFLRLSNIALLCYFGTEHTAGSNNGAIGAFRLLDCVGCTLHRVWCWIVLDCVGLCWMYIVQRAPRHRV